MFNGSTLASAPQTNARPTVLLVEDDPYVAKFIRKRLILEGFAVVECSDGKEALVSLRTEPLPDLILSDLRMPQLDGFALLETIRDMEQASHLPIIILSGAGTVEERVNCLERGAADYLCKPIDGVELAARVRMHLRNTAELRRLRKEARFDPLTRCLNRRGAVEALQREIDRCHRAETPMSVMLIDADRFKHINDTYGHAAGDVVLLEIANTLKECLRMTDVVGRLGGDEFVIALPGVGDPLATQIKTRLRERIAKNIVPGSEHPVSISIGLVVDTEAEFSLAQLFEHADAAMYRDKRNRRNTLTVLKVVEPEPEEAAQESLP
ncbi:MAG: diguanylate cyclase [Myxococcales bacterium]|nr:diguanylate cyclase [Myxococcales bacterium]